VRDPGDCLREPELTRVVLKDDGRIPNSTLHVVALRGALQLPPDDPVYGANGPLIEAWSTP
jgi:hypothetical protein